MKITFVANVLNHHQLPFCLEMDKLTDHNFTFISYEKLTKERASIGFQDMSHFAFVVRSYISLDAMKQAIDHIVNDDMVIFGSCPDAFIEKRRDTGKPFIIYSERFFKKGTYRRFIPITMKKIRKRMLQFEGNNCSIICSSAYLPYDLSLMHAQFQTYKWGYFPRTPLYDINKLLMEKRANRVPSILWVGRLIELKHPDASIRIAKILKKEGYDFELNILGDGKIKPYLERLVTKYDLLDKVHFLGAKPAEEVRRYMEKANIFLFTSDYNEGWGAVINESMNSGCAVVASHAAGSVPFLVKDNENGFVYKSGDINHLHKKVKYLLDNPQERDRLGLQAYKTIAEQWNPQIATKRLFRIIESKINGDNDELYDEGPCSIAPIIEPRYRGE